MQGRERGMQGRGEGHAGKREGHAWEERRGKIITPLLVAKTGDKSLILVNCVVHIYLAVLTIGACAALEMVFSDCTLSYMNM